MANRSRLQINSNKVNMAEVASEKNYEKQFQQKVKTLSALALTIHTLEEITQSKHSNRRENQLSPSSQLMLSSALHIDKSSSLNP